VAQYVNTNGSGSGDNTVNSELKNYHLKNEFLLQWFSQFHYDNFEESVLFSKDLLFNDKYLSHMLFLGLPNEFESVDMLPEDFLVEGANDDGQLDHNLKPRGPLGNPNKGVVPK
jgi:hypothetical protein